MKNEHSDHNDNSSDRNDLSAIRMIIKLTTSNDKVDNY